MSPLSNFNYSRWPPWTRIKLRKRLSYDGLDYIKGKHSVNMSCNNVCLSNFIHINLFYISIV